MSGNSPEAFVLHAALTPLAPLTSARTSCLVLLEATSDGTFTLYDGNNHTTVACDLSVEGALSVLLALARRAQADARHRWFNHAIWRATLNDVHESH